MPEGLAGRPRSERVQRLILDTAFESVLEAGFRAVSVESIAARAGVGKTTIYRRWPNKAAVVMDAFLLRVGSGTLFPAAEKAIDSIRPQMRAMAHAFRGRDGDLIRALLAEAQFDAELAVAFRARWTLPRRRMALAVFEAAVRQGDIGTGIDLEAVIDLLYAPLYYRLQMRTEPLSNAYVDRVFQLVMEGVISGGKKRAGAKEKPRLAR